MPLTTADIIYTVHATKEVILSAGAIKTPHLCGSHSLFMTNTANKYVSLVMLSGIGEASYLASFGIKVISDLPDVGTNLQVVLPSSPMYWFTN